MDRLTSIFGKSARLARSREVWLLLLMASIIFVYAFVCSAGRLGQRWPMYMTYYDLLAEGFRSGHLYVPVRPSPALLSSPDPFAFSNQRHWLWDGSLYKGRYYLYWGPVPGLLLAIAKTAFRIRGPVGDPILSFVAFSCSAIFGALIIDRAGRRLFGAAPRWLRGLFIVSFGLANPLPHLLASSGVYMACIGAGQAFALGGLLFAFDAVWRAPSERFDWRLGAAGAMWALAMGSRATMIPVTGVMAGMTLVACVWPAQARGRCLVAAASLLIGPMLLGVVALMVYNRLRFDDWLQVGIDYQTTTLKFQMSPRYWLTNFYSYTLRPVFWTCRFPFAIAPAVPGPEAYPDGMKLPEGYLLIEPVVGWLRGVPLTWLLPILPFAYVRRLRQWRANPSRVAHGVRASDARTRSFLWLVSCLTVLATLSGMPAMGLYMPTMRYLADFSNALVLLAILSGFCVFTWATKVGVRNVAAFALGAPALATITLGVLLGYQGYIGHFKTFNPTLDAKLVETLSLCAPGRLHSKHER